jgi:hypothetical protein
MLAELISHHASGKIPGTANHQLVAWNSELDVTGARSAIKITE